MTHVHPLHSLLFYNIMYKYETVPPSKYNLFTTTQPLSSQEHFYKMFWLRHLNNILTSSILFITSIFELDSPALSQTKNLS